MLQLRFIRLYRTSPTRHVTQDPPLSGLVHTSTSQISGTGTP